MSYTVDVTREDGEWLADVQNMPGGHTFARNLLTLDRYVREVIAVIEDMDDDVVRSLDIEYNYVGVPQVVLQAAKVGGRRRLVEREASQVVDESVACARALSAAGFSVRDAASLLGISPGRVQQLVAA